MTSLLLGPQPMNPDGGAPSAGVAHPAGHLDGVADAIEMDSSKLLAIARALAHRARHWPGMAAPTRRTWDLMAASEAFEAWVISWSPGGAIDLHDHGGSSGAVVVAAGELVELAVAEDRRGGALKTLARRSTVPVELHLRADRRPPEHVEVAAYYVACKALANAAKHAEASLVNVALDTEASNLQLSVRDDGVGGADPGRGSGLVGLADRIEALGGRLEISSPVGGGTSLSVDPSRGAGHRSPARTFWEVSIAVSLTGWAPRPPVA